MNVLFLADAVFEDIPGGSRVVARELARGLVGRGHQVTFLVGGHSPDAPADEMRPDGIRVVRYGGAGQGMRFVRRGQEACPKLWAEGGFDLVHTHFAFAGVGPLRTLPPALPRVRTFHGPWDAEGWVEDRAHEPGWRGHLMALAKRQFRRRVEAASLRASDHVLTLSEAFRSEVIGRFGVPAGRVQKIAGGTDTARFRPADPGEARRALGLPLDRRVLLSVRRLVPRMGLDNLLEALPAVVARHPDVLLVLGGKGPERERLERLVAARRLEAHVRMVGYISEADLPRYFQAADLFVLPTVALEGFGLVTTEALACGTPVVGTHIGATPEILSALEPRLIAPGTSPAALAAALRRFLEEDWKAALTPQRLHEYVCRHYTWDRHVAQTEVLYEAAIARSRSPRLLPAPLGAASGR